MAAAEDSNESLEGGAAHERVAYHSRLSGKPSRRSQPVAAALFFFIAADILAFVAAECGLDGLPRRARADARAARASALAFFTALPCPPSRDWASPAAISRRSVLNVSPSSLSVRALIRS